MLFPVAVHGVDMLTRTKVSINVTFSSGPNSSLSKQCRSRSLSSSVNALTSASSRIRFLNYSPRFDFSKPPRPPGSFSAAVRAILAMFSASLSLDLCLCILHQINKSAVDNCVPITYIAQFALTYIISSRLDLMCSSLTSMSPISLS